jgi:spore cortex biosynthesis protein YabQ
LSDLTAATQFYTFIVTLLLGTAAGIIFDFYRVLRNYWRPRPFTTLFADLFFWMLLTILVLVILIQVSWGEVRFYVFLGLSLGALLYYHFCSRWTIRLWLAFFKLVKSVYCFIYRVGRRLCLLLAFLLSPFITLTSFLLRMLQKCGRKTGAKLRQPAYSAKVAVKRVIQKILQKFGPNG